MLTKGLVMSTLFPVKKVPFFKRVKLILLLVLALIALAIVTSDQFNGFMEALTPPKLRPVPIHEKQVWFNQNWSMDETRKYHHISQGTHTFPIPLEWLLSLEAPKDFPLALLFFKNGRFADNDYLLRHGFIRGVISEHNPHGLPIGFATTEFQHLTGIDRSVTAVGMTCAGCHTAHITHEGTEYIIEGGPASVDLPILTKTLGAALGQTLISSKIPFFNGRFERFAQAVLKDNYSVEAKVQLAKELESVVKAQAANANGIDVVEGFARLDALNRIGNQVFAFGPNRPENYTPINAPVAYPHIWTSSWFDWVQYNGSIMQPLIRNAGEAMGVQAQVNYLAPLKDRRFSSGVPIMNLKWIEDFLSGPEPYPQKRFEGLLSPQWSEFFPPPEAELVMQGQTLYEEHCQGCHLPTLNSDEIWKHFSPIEYHKNKQLITTEEHLLRLKIIPLTQLGTDPAQAKILAQRTVNTAGIINTDVDNIGINTQVCLPSPTLGSSKKSKDSDLTQDKNYRYSSKDAYLQKNLYSTKPSDEAANDDVYGSKGDTVSLVHVPITDGPMLNFAFALGAIVQQVNDQWFDNNFIRPSQRTYFEGERPNCLQAPMGYKARPLNGIWATAPFLHNGSVANLYEMLVPAEERTQYVQLGSTELDVEKVGIKQDPKLAKRLEKNGLKKGLYQKGYFILDTSLPGNSNQGHEFSKRYDPERGYDDQPQGVIGPQLSHEERLALIAFLKTL